MEQRWLREDALNISLAAGDMKSAATSILTPLGGRDTLTASELIAVLMLSAHIDGWNFRRAMIDGQDIAAEVAARLTQ